MKTYPRHHGEDLDDARIYFVMNGRRDGDLGLATKAMLLPLAFLSMCSSNQISGACALSHGGPCSPMFTIIGQRQDLGINELVLSGSPPLSSPWLPFITSSKSRRHHLCTLFAHSKQRDFHLNYRDDDDDFRNVIEERKPFRPRIASAIGLLTRYPGRSKKNPLPHSISALDSNNVDDVLPDHNINHAKIKGTDTKLTELAFLSKRRGSIGSNSKRKHKNQNHRHQCA